MKPSNHFLLWVAGLVSVGGILYGYDMGVISGALLFIKDSIPLTDEQIGWIVGAVLAGGLLGTLLAGPMGDYLGRRFLIAMAAVTFIAGVIFILFANSFVMLLLARLLLGTAVGMVAVAVPLYVAEIVPSKDRGKYITVFQLLLTFGIVLAYFVDLIFTPTGNWRGMFAVLFIPSLILLLGILKLPETPRWLMTRNRYEEARLILCKLRHSEKEVDDEIHWISQSLKQAEASWRDFFSRQFLALAFLAVLIAIFNQLTGINSFLQYAPLILKNAGISSNEVTMIGSVGIGALNFVFTLVAISLIDSLGRRPLLLIGVLGVVLAEMYLGTVSLFFSNLSYAGLLALGGLLLFIAFFAIGPGVVVWLAISEVVSYQNSRQKASPFVFFLIH